jgi:hypothetical protein
MKPNRISARRGVVVCATALALLASPGCLWAPELSGVRDDIQDQLPGATFDRNIEISFGRVGLALARLAAAIVPGAREARPYLRDVSAVKVGVYDARVTSTSGLRMPRKLQSLLDEGWELAIRVRDGNDAVWLLYRADEESIREVFIVVLNEDELVLVKAKGRLDRLVGYALRESHGRPWVPRERPGHEPSEAPSGT